MIWIGFGGSNSVIILEEGPDYSHKVINNDGFEHDTSPYNETVLKKEAQVEAQNGVGTDRPSPDSRKRLYVFSAKSESSLFEYLASFKEYIDGVIEYDTFMKDLSFTLGQRRTHHSYRAAVAADSLTSLKANLSNVKPRKTKTPVIAFVFTGQGAQ